MPKISLKVLLLSLGLAACGSQPKVDRNHEEPAVEVVQSQENQVAAESAAAVLNSSSASEALGQQSAVIPILRCTPPSIRVCWYDEADYKHCYCTSRPLQ